MLRHSKHERNALYYLLSTRARASTRALRVPQGDMPSHVQQIILPVQRLVRSLITGFYLSFKISLQPFSIIKNTGSNWASS